MAISFPSTPSLNQTYAVGSKTWIYNGYAWDLQLTNTSVIFAAANSASVLAQNAYNTANNALPKSGGTITGSLQVNQDVTVGANLSVLGTFTTYSSNTVTTNSSIIFVATNNTGNVVDMGIVGTFKGGTNNNQQYTGIIRDPNIGKWRFFSNAYSQPTTDVDFSDANIIFDAIQVGGITSPTATINNLELYSYTTAAYAQANAISSYANTQITLNSGVNTGQNAYAQAAFSKANGAVQTAFTTLIANGTSFTSATSTGTFSISAAAANGINILNPSANTIDFGLRTTGVTVNTYGNTTSIPSISVDAFGRVLSISNNAISTSFSLAGTSGTGTISGGGTLTFAGSSGVTAAVSGSTITINTPQSVQTSASPTFAGVLLSNTATYNTVVTQSSLSTVTQTQIDIWPTTTYRTAKYLIQMTQGANYHSIELLLVHNGTTAYLSQFAEVATGTILGTFDASITAGQLSLLLTPVSSSAMTINIVKNLISI